MRLPPSLLRETEWAIAHCSASIHCSEHNVQTVRRALRGLPGLFPNRFGIFVDNAGPLHDSAPEEKQRLGRLLVALDDWAAGRRWTLLPPEEWARQASPEEIADTLPAETASS